MGRTQKVRMFKRVPRRPKTAHYQNEFNYKWDNMNYLLIISITITKSKSVHGSEPKTDLSTCDMVAYEARKATYEIVQISATVRDRNL